MYPVLSESKPTCAVVIYKDDESENVCNQEASFLLSIVNDESQVSGVILLCQRHSEMFDEGKELIVLGEDGTHLSVQGKPTGENQDVTRHESRTTDARTPGGESDEAGSGSGPA
jgi:hypothetical protein